MADMTVNEKMTQKEIYQFIADELADNRTVVDFCEKKIKQLENRAKAPRKPRFNLEANAFATEVINVLKAADRAMTNKEIAEAMSKIAPWSDAEKPVSAQKVAAALRRIDKHEVMFVENGEPVDAIDETLVIVEGEKKSDPKVFYLA